MLERRREGDVEACAHDSGKLASGIRCLHLGRVHAEARFDKRYLVECVEVLIVGVSEGGCDVVNTGDSTIAVVFNDTSFTAD